jgi:hypothetical protein
MEPHMTDKQIITLSTGVITLTVTFLEKIVPPSSPAMGRTVPWTMFVAWVAFGAAIQAAIVTLGAVTGTMDAIDRKANGLSTNSQQDLAVTSLASGRNVTIPAIVMALTFAAGEILTIATGFLLLP